MAYGNQFTFEESLSVARNTNGYKFSAVAFVGWTDAPVIMVPWKFETIGLKEIPVLDATLPSGFRMNDHPEWVKLKDQILQGYKDASFEALDLINIDLEALLKITGWHVGDDCNPLWDDRKDWVEWTCSFDDQWSQREYEVEQLFLSAVPHMPVFAGYSGLCDHIGLNALDCLPIGNRINPPSLVESLEIMLAKAKESDPL
jgi:hypothetical protein